MLQMRYVTFVYFRYVACKMANSPSYFQQVDAGGGAGLQSNVADDIRTHFRTREGVYRLMKLSEYSRPTRSPPNGPNTTPFRIAFVSAPDTYNRRVDDLLAFIVGKELYVYYYNGVRKVRTGLRSYFFKKAIVSMCECADVATGKGGQNLWMLSADVWVKDGCADNSFTYITSHESC